MRQAQIVYFETNLDKEIIAETISESFALKTVFVNDLFRKQTSIKSDLTLEIKKYLDIGEVMPDFLTNKLIENEIDKEADKDILVVGYPRTTMQFESLATMFSQRAVSISIVWHFKHFDFDKFIEELYKEKKQWSDKYGDDMKSQWSKKQDKIVNKIALLKSIGGAHKWTDIALTYENFTDKNYINSVISKFYPRHKLD